MGKVVITVAATVDGVIDGFEWFVPGGEHDEASLDQFRDAAGMLLGRKSYEGFAGFWPTQEGPWADMLNPLPKYVASRTLSEPLEWNARLLQGEMADAVRTLKQELEGDLVVSGVGEFARNLLEQGLVDEVRFWVHPVVWNEGARPFDGARLRLQLLEAKPFDSGVTLLRYEPVAAD